MIRRISLISLLVVWLNGMANAQIVTDRPDQTESALTVPCGALQIESGVLVGFEGDSHTSDRQILLPTSLFRYGITKGFELRLVNQFEMIKSAEGQNHGISDLEVGTKIRLLNKKNLNTQIAFLSHFIIPSGTKEISSEQFGTSNKLSISHTLADNVALGYNVGYNTSFDGKGDLTYTLSLGIGVNDKVGIYAEPYGAMVDMEKFVSSFDAGFTYLANQNLQFDFSFGVGVNQRMNYLSLGCSWLVI